MKRLLEYRKRAEQCRDQARTQRTEDVRAHFLWIASTWDRLADVREEQLPNLTATSFETLRR